MTQQREIKFRVWDKTTKTLNYDDGVILNFGQQIASFYLEKEYYPYKEDRPFSEIILSQFTGLRDAEGKEVFEGDIIKDGGYNEYDIEYNDRWVIRYKAEGFYGCGFSAEYLAGDDESLRNFRKIVVVGNIFENPELIEKSLSEM